MVKATYLEKISFKLAKLMGSPISLLLHTAVFGGFFILRYLGIIPNAAILVLTAAACLEAIYMVIFVQMIIKNNTNSLMEMQAQLEEIQQEEEDTHKLMVNILHLAHQMKTLQQSTKTSGNGHGRRAHA